MTIVLRLKGLNVHAGSKDIRKFFDNLQIPNGGIYILGGKMGEAFIVFTSEKDGQLAMRKSGNFIRGSQISLSISSAPELQHRMEAKLQKSKPLLNPTPIKELVPTIVEPAPLPDASAIILGLISVLNEMSKPKKEETAPSICSFATPTDVTELNLRSSKTAVDTNPGYVRLYGLSASVTKQDICNYFKGLPVEEVIVNVKMGLCRCCLVKFADIKNANDALHFDRHGLGSNHLDIRGASEKMWISAVRECGNTSNKDQEMLYKSSEFEYKTQKRPSSDSWGDRALHKSHTSTFRRESPQEVCTKRPFEDPLLSQSPKRPRSDSKSTTDLQGAAEYCIMAKNLSPGITKTEIKELFSCQHIKNNKILHLLDSERMRTDTVFILFNQLEDYLYAMNLNGCPVRSKAIAVSTVTRIEIESMLSSTKAMDLKETFFPRGNTVTKWRSKNLKSTMATTAPTCLYVRNLPADVCKADLQNFFYQFRLGEELIVLLKAKDGNGIGEAVVQFKTEKIAARARKLHGRTFMGTSVLLTLISFKQMEEILNINQ